MEIKVNRSNSANASATAIVGKDILEKKLQKAASDAAKNMKVDGFRKGKVPVSIVKSRYAEQLQQDSEQAILREVVDHIIKELEIEASKIIGDPQITRFDRSDDGLDLEIKIGIVPQIDLSRVEECIPEFKEEEVGEDEVLKRLEDIALSQAPLENIEDDRALEGGDYAVVDFEGFIDGEPMENGSAEGYSLHIGSNSFIEGFEEQLKGMKKGEEKEIEVTFPKEYGNSAIAGKEAKFKVKLNEIKIKKPLEVDDELAKKLLKEDDADLGKLKEKIKDQILSEKMSKLYNEDLKPKVLESFAETIIFDVPDFVVEQEIDLAFRNALPTMSEEEIETLRKDPEAAKAKREEYKENAHKSVKVTFIVDALAKQEGVEVDDNEIVQTIYYEALNSGQNPKETLELYQERGLMPAIKMSMIEDKLLSLLLDKKLKG